MRRESITLVGGPLHYWRIDRGSGDNLIMLHGLGGNHAGLAELAAGVPGPNVIIPDLPGYGESAPLTGAHSLTGYADTIAELRSVLKLGRVHLLGHSLGASIALVHAARHGATLQSLCLLNPVSTATGLTAGLGKLYYRIGAKLPATLARYWLASRPAVYLSDAFVIVTPDRARRRWILAQDYLNYRRASVRAMTESFLSYFDTPFDTHAAAVDVPALLVTGQRDAIAPPPSVTGLAARMTIARCVVLPHAGHLVPVERPAEIAALVSGFLTELVGSGAADGPMGELTG